MQVVKVDHSFWEVKEGVGFRSKVGLRGHEMDALVVGNLDFA